MKTRILFALAIVFISGNVVLADNYDAIRNLPISASNAIIQNIRDGYRQRDYRLFQAAAQRAIEFKLSASLPVFKEIFAAGDPTSIIAQPPIVAELQPYYRYSALGIGTFGDEHDAEILADALMDNRDAQNLFYIISALGMMAGKQAALDALNGFAIEVDNTLLAREIVRAIGKHNSRSSLNPLRMMLSNTRFGIIRDEITNMINKLETSGEQ